MGTDARAGSDGGRDTSLSDAFDAAPPIDVGSDGGSDVGVDAYVSDVWDGIDAGLCPLAPANCAPNDIPTMVFNHPRPIMNDCQEIEVRATGSRTCDSPPTPFRVIRCYDGFTILHLTVTAIGDDHDTAGIGQYVSPAPGECICAQESSTEATLGDLGGSSFSTTAQNVEYVVFGHDVTYRIRACAMSLH